MIRKPFDSFLKKCSCPGTRIKDKHMIVKDPKCFYLEKVGEIDVQDLYDSYKDQTDIYKLLNNYVNVSGITPGDRVNIVGDVDFSNVPTNIFDLKRVINNSRDIYNKMPEDFKNDYSYNDFIKNLPNSNDFLKYFPKKNDVHSEVIKDES